MGGCLDTMTIDKYLVYTGVHIHTKYEVSMSNHVARKTVTDNNDVDPDTNNNNAG